MIAPTGHPAADGSTTARWELRLGDCLDPEHGLASLPEESVDVAITDPPYAESIYRNTRTNRGRLDLRTPHDIDHAWEVAALAIGTIDDILPVVAAHLLRVTRRWIVVFHDAETADRWRIALGEGLGRRFLGWERDPRYHRRAHARLSRTFEQLELLPAGRPGETPRRSRQRTIEDVLPRAPPGSVEEAPTE